MKRAISTDAKVEQNKVILRKQFEEIKELSEEDISRSQSLTNIDATCIETSPLNRLTGDNEQFVFSGRQFLTSLGQQELKEGEGNWQKTVPANIIKTDKKGDKKTPSLDHKIGEFISQGKMNQTETEPPKVNSDNFKQNETEPKIVESEISSEKEKEKENQILSKKVEVEFDPSKCTQGNSTPSNNDGLSPDISEKCLKRSESPEKSAKSEAKMHRFANLGTQLKSRSSSQFHGFGSNKTFSRSFDSEIKNYDQHRTINTEYQDTEVKGSFSHLNLVQSEPDIKNLASSLSPTSEGAEQQSNQEHKRLSLGDKLAEKSEITMQLSLKSKHLLKTGYQISRELFHRKKTSPQFNLSSTRKKPDFLTDSLELSRQFKKKEPLQPKDKPSPLQKGDAKSGSAKVKIVKT